MKQERLIPKNFQDTPIGSKFGNLITLGIPFAIKNGNNRRLTFCVTQCQKCKEIYAHDLVSIKRESKKGNSCCAKCYHTRAIPIINNKYPEPGSKIWAYTVLGVPFYIRNDKNQRKIYIVVQCNCDRIYAKDLFELIRDRDSFRKAGCITCTAPKNLPHALKDPKDKVTGRRLYGIWAGIKTRCKSHPLYAGNNITYCSDWELYPNFEKWAYENGYKDEDGKYYNKLSIDRINPKGNYCPENCRWVPRNENSRNVTKVRDETIELLESKCKYLENLLRNNNIEYSLDNLKRENDNENI